MGLKGFHIVFISFSVVLLLGFAYWALQQLAQLEQIKYAFVAAGSIVCAIGLTVYEFLFIRKLKV